MAHSSTTSALAKVQRRALPERFILGMLYSLELMSWKTQEMVNIVTFILDRSTAIKIISLFNLYLSLNFVLHSIPFPAYSC